MKSSIYIRLSLIREGGVKLDPNSVPINETVLHSFRKNTMRIGKSTYLGLTRLFRTTLSYASDFYGAISYSAFSDDTH